MFYLCRPVYQHLDGRLEEAFLFRRVREIAAACLPDVGPALVGAQVANPTKNLLGNTELCRRLTVAPGHVCQYGQAVVRHAR